MAFKASLKLPVLPVLLAFVLLCNLSLALAQSGGAVGASSFSSGSSSSSGSFIDGDYDGDSTDDDRKTGLWVALAVVVLLLCCFVGLCLPMRGGKGVLMLQVGLLGKARSIQRGLNRIAFTADTATVKDFHNILKETTSALLQHSTYCISGYSSVDDSMGSLEEHFNKLSHEEREKFDIESLVNINNVKIQRTSVPEVKKHGAEYIVVTILVAANGAHKLPVINNSESLKQALQYLASIDVSKIKAVHVLWTPQNENDALVEEELLKNYPLLRPISDSVSDFSTQEGEASAGFSKSIFRRGSEAI